MRWNHLFACLRCTVVLCITAACAYAQVPPNSVPATPNTMFYAGGACTFYSATGTVLMSVNAAEAQWSCSPARAAWASVTPASGGYYEFPSFTSIPMSEDRSKLLRPFWRPETDTVYNEYVLLNGIGSTASLLYTPKQIVAIENYDGSVDYTVGEDVTVDGRTLTQRTQRVSSTVSITPGKRGNGTPNGLMNTAHTSWTRVTYLADRSTWQAPESLAFPRTGHPLPGVERILVNRRPLVVQAVGMSLTGGHNVSGGAVDGRNFPPTAPYMRGYCELFADELASQWRASVTLHNSSCSGKTISWAAQYIAPLAVPNAPDLVILDMGMNDIWGQTTPDQFRRDAQRCIDSVRKYLPNAEFLLIANMIPDTAGAGAPINGAAIMRSLARELQSMQSPGIAVLDMTSISEAVFARKGSASCMANSLHPNDYFARWYAQALVEFISAPATSVSEEHSQSIRLDHSNGILTIKGATPGENATVTIRDIRGGVVEQTALPITSDATTAQLSSCSRGVYIITVELTDGTTAQSTIFIM